MSSELVACDYFCIYVFLCLSCCQLYQLLDLRVCRQRLIFRRVTYHHCSHFQFFTHHFKLLCRRFLVLCWGRQLFPPNHKTLGNRVSVLACPELPKAACVACLCGLFIAKSDVSDCVSFVILTILIVLLMGEYVGSICWIFCEGKKSNMKIQDETLKSIKSSPMCCRHNIAC